MAETEVVTFFPEYSFFTKQIPISNTQTGRVNILEAKIVEKENYSHEVIWL